MIIVKITGGLGNQMFQYAMGKKLALKHNSQLILDTSELLLFQNPYNKRFFELEVFPTIKENLLFLSDNYLIKSFYYYKIWIKLYRKIKGIRAIYQDLQLAPEYYSSLPDQVYLDGIWNSESFFKGYESTIRNSFVFNSNLDDANQKWLEKINNCTSISLHVRRGDYLSDQHRSIYNICNRIYYQNAMDFIIQSVSNPQFFVFSDDISWAKENINHPNYIFYYVENNTGSQSFEDMRLMSHCAHHITANSTFSWWGAWLNSNPGKIVLAPAKWYRIHPSMQLPDGWIGIEFD
jgi:hypothetical protein